MSTAQNGSKPPIAIIETIGSHGGMHYYTDNQAHALVNQGHRVTLYSLPASTDAGARYRKVDTFKAIYGPDPKAIRGLRLIRDLTTAIVSARRWGAKVCIFHLFKMDIFELYAARLCRMLGMKSMAVVHDVARLDQPNDRPQLARIAGFTDLLITHNGFSETALLQALAGAPANVSVIPSGNYIAQFPNPPSKAQARDRLKLPHDKQVILFFGNPRREKGLHVLLEAMVAHRDNERLLVLVAGKMKPDEEAEYRGFARANGLDARVRFDIGHVDDADVPSYYRAPDIVALPYLRIYESAVALMAMSLERPVLASDLPPMRDVIGEDVRGLLFAASDAQALSARIGDLMADPARLADLAANAAHYAANDRHWDVTGRMLSAAAQSL
ncbi:glycosyltransferase involved in cell wall biosynthesis [Blastomonas natatoria]|uniref:Glycosyltransferase involved in cell wall biosynthesis n=1 Tax=Blastomonas natatoria TaxID=34015 RepID=A0A2V3V593_9SPHN|nr:glycosyltransferase family 4 protein [Blastomonas natatoria]PXW76284.1 glycosyltransferase involved in cell wall biosynthesis [Blastomonas natatoria]